MADLKPFAGLSSEDTSALMLMLLAEIRDKLPRLDNNDRLVVNGSEIAAALASVAVTTLNNIIGMGTVGTVRPADAVPIHMANIGALHIYQAMKVI